MGVCICILQKKNRPRIQRPYFLQNPKNSLQLNFMTKSSHTVRIAAIEDAAIEDAAIEDAAIEDAAILDRLNAAFNDSSDGAENFAQRLADPRRVDTPLLMEVNEQVVGFACLRVVPNLFYPDPYAELTELYLEPKFRRRGLGRMLVAYAENLAREQGARSMKILTGDDNEEGHALYRAMGYHDDEETVFVKRL